MEVLTTFVAAGFAIAFKKLIESYVDQRVKQYFANPASIKTDFEPHLKATFDKCTRIKTVLDGTKPLNMLDIYAGQNFEIHKQHVDHYKLIEHIKNIGDVNDSNAYVLTGTGGGGKSMFMRYLWISLFVDSRGKIPFFLELRNFDKAKHGDLEDFIYQSVIKTGSTISKENFTNGLRAGEFYLLLDGFDEVAHDSRQELQAHIISLRENNPHIPLIISSRPDDRFLGWNQFEIIEVLPLNEKQVRDLIKKAPFDREKKTTFLINLGSIYQTHESFLSTPLLAYMMLIAYADNQNLPDRMVDFYEQAFNALFERHDLMKNGYKRKLYCNLGRTEFKKLISLICLKSYSQERYEFTQEELETLIGEAQKPLSLNQIPQNVISDLTESLCFLKKEGLSYDFTHRSFQEYFAAYCLTWFNTNIFSCIEKFATRLSDNVVLMYYQLDPQMFRKFIVASIYEDQKDFFKNYDYTLEFVLKYFSIPIPILILDGIITEKEKCLVLLDTSTTSLLINLSRQISRLFLNFTEECEEIVVKLNLTTQNLMYVGVKNDNLFLFTTDHGFILSRLAKK